MCLLSEATPHPQENHFEGLSMIIEFNQYEQHPHPKHKIMQRGQILATAETPQFKHGILYADRQYELSIQGLSSVSVTCGAAQICSILPKVCVTKKILFLPIGYEYYEMSLREKTYLVYEVGLGPDQHYYCFYDGDRTAAILHKPDRVINYMDHYIGYLESNEQLLAVMLFCLFLESGGNYQNGDLGNSDYSTETVTKQKELIAKYDPLFIPRILAQEAL